MPQYTPESLSRIDVPASGRLLYNFVGYTEQTDASSLWISDLSTGITRQLVMTGASQPAEVLAAAVHPTGRWAIAIDELSAHARMYIADLQSGATVQVNQRDGLPAWNVSAGTHVWLRWLRDDELLLSVSRNRTTEVLRFAVSPTAPLRELDYHVLMGTLEGPPIADQRGVTMYDRDVDLRPVGLRWQELTPVGAGSRLSTMYHEGQWHEYFE